MPSPSQISVVLVRPCVYIGENVNIGHGKIDLLREVGKTHSIAAAARALAPSLQARLAADRLAQQGL